MIRRALSSAARDWTVAPSSRASKTIASILTGTHGGADRGKGVRRTQKKKLINLSLGDPAAYMPAHPLLAEKIAMHVARRRNNEYPPPTGLQQARAAVAAIQAPPVTVDDVIITSGCSGALGLVFPTLADAGDNILLPKPTFPLYTVLADNLGIEPRFYSLHRHSEEGWAPDPKELNDLVDDNTKALLLNNPSNPMGVVLSKAVLERFVGFAAEKRLPVISDEVYEHMTFGKHTFHHVSSLAPQSPVLSLSSLSKRYLVPGWRLGWVAIHDPCNQLDGIREALHSMCMLTLGANSVTQAALPLILKGTPPEFHSGVLEKLEAQAQVCVNSLGEVRELTVVEPEGALYLMFKVDFASFDPDIQDDAAFARGLFEEEQVSILPGTPFGAPSFCRLAFCANEATLAEACDRIKFFVRRHSTTMSGDVGLVDRVETPTRR